MQKHHYFILAFLAAAVFAGGVFLGPKKLSNIAETVVEPTSSEAIASESAVEYKLSPLTVSKHIFGAGIPCNSEFPQNWPLQKVSSTLSEMAQDQSLQWKQEKNGYFVAEKKVEGLDVRVVVDREKQTIVTGYPLNVERNECPNKDENPFSDDAEQ